MNKHNNPTSPRSTRILIWLAGATLLLTAIHLFLQYLNLEVFYQQQGQVYELSNRFDLDDETSVPTWFSQILFLLIGAAAFTAAYLERKTAVKRLWALIGVFGVVYSLDESAGLHEFVLQTLHVLYYQDAAPTKENNAWLIAVPLILAVLLWLGWLIFRYFPVRTLVLFAVSAGLFLAGAVGVDLATSVTGRETFWNQGVLVAAEETFELLATVLALYAVIDYVERRHFASLSAAIAQLKHSKSGR